MQLASRTLSAIVILLATLWLGLIGYAYWPSGIDEVPAAELAGPDDQFIDIDGLRLRYREWGEPASGRPTTILIHGFANSLQSYLPLAPAIEDSYHVIALDLPGFGLSDKPAGHDYGNASHAAVVSSFMDARDLDDVIVTGHSLGGGVALRLAVDDPRVAGMVLINPGIISTGVPAFTRFLFFPLPRISARLFGDRDFRGDALRSSFINPDLVTDDMLDRLMLASRSEGYMAGMTSMMGQYGRSDSEVPLLARIRLPTLVIWGEQDTTKPDPQQELRQLLDALPEHTMVLRLPGAGHYAHEEGPSEVARAMREFVAQRL